LWTNDKKLKQLKLITQHSPTLLHKKAQKGL
jgi:hypothetical protein